jgi:predicted kinase
MKKLKVLILIGVPASGKSTWSLDFVRTNPDWVRVSRDDFRFMLKNQPVCEPRIELLINTIQDSVILDALAKGLNVIIDNTNLKKKYIEHFAKLVEPYASVEFQIFDISLEKALERDAARFLAACSKREKSWERSSRKNVQAIRNSNRIF